MVNCSSDINLYMMVYIFGAFLLITCLPLVFLLSLSNPVSVFTFAILAKIGSGLMIISQITIIPKITLNKSRRVRIMLKIEKTGVKSCSVWARRDFYLHVLYGSRVCVRHICMEILLWCMRIRYCRGDMLNYLCL